MSKKKLILLISLIFLLIPITVSAAEDNENKKSQSISGTLVEKDYSKLEDGEEANYYLDVSAKTGDEEDKNAVENFFDTAKSWVTGDAIKDGISAQFYEFINLTANLIFEWNKMATNIMIGFLNFAFETEIIDNWIDVLDDMMGSLTGINNLRFTENGLFGSFIGFITVFAALATVFQIVFKRALIGAFGTLAKTVLVLGLSLILFTNYAPFMKGMNLLSNTISQSLLTGSSNSVTEDHRSPDELREDVSKNLWDMFIVRPYLIMQYGEENIDKVGVDRVNKLLKMPKGEKRQKYIEQMEISENGNKMMTYDKVPDRFVFSFIYSPINAIVSIPIYLLALALIVFQIWFLLMGFVAPFALVWAAFPGQIGVLKKYAIELSFPLICKVFATVATLFIFVLGFMVYNIGSAGNISQYLIIVFMQFVMLVLLFLLRKRISGIFKAGKNFALDRLREDVNSLKESISDLGKGLVNVGVAATTGGSSAAATAAAGEILDKSSKVEVDDNNDYADQENDGSVPLTTIAGLAAGNTATAADAAKVATAAASNAEDNNEDEDEDGSKPLAKATDIDQQKENEEESEKPHLRLVHNANEEDEEEIGETNEADSSEGSVNDETIPLVSMDDYMDSSSAETAATAEDEGKDPSVSNWEGDQPLVSMYDFLDETNKSEVEESELGVEAEEESKSEDASKLLASINQEEYKSADEPVTEPPLENTDSHQLEEDMGDVRYKGGASH